MKPVVTAFKAWSCIVISLFAIVILSVLALLFKANHHSMMSSTDDPADGHTVAKTCLGAISVYGAFLVFCGAQAWLHKKEARGGAINLN